MADASTPDGGPLSEVEVRALEAVFEADPKNRRALLSLAGHYVVIDELKEVDRLLGHYLSTVSGGPAALQALLRSARTPEASVRAGLLVRLAGMQLYRLGDPRGARATAHTALKVQPGLEAARAILDTTEDEEQTGVHNLPPTLRRSSGPAVDDDPKTQPGARVPRIDDLPEFLQEAPDEEPAERAEGEIDTAEVELGAALPEAPGGTTTLTPLGDDEGDLTEANPFAEAHPEIVAACDTLLSQPMDPADRLSALHALERGQEGGAERAMVHQALSRAYEAGGDRDRAFYSLVRAARLAIPARRVLDELFRLAMLTGAFTELSAVYEDNLGGPLAPHDRTYLHLKLGHLYSRELARPEAARAHYERVLQIDDHSSEALARLAELNAAAERWPELASIRERELALARADSDLAAQARAQRELARLYEENLGKPEKAIEQYQAMLAVLPDNPAAINGLARLASRTESAERRETALRSLRASLEAAGRWDELAEQLVEQAARLVRAEQNAEAVRHYLDAAAIHLHRRGDGERALIELMRAARAHGEGDAPGPTTSEILEALIAAGRAAGSLPQAVAVAEDLLERVDPGERSSLTLRLIDLELTELGRPEGAVDRALALLQKSAAPERWIEPIEARFVQRGLWQSLARFYDGAASQAPGAPMALAPGGLLFRLAEIQESELDELPAARSTYERILRGDLTSLPALDAFLRLAPDEASARRKLSELISQEPPAADAGKETPRLPRAEWLLRRARLLAAEGDEAGARADFSRVLELDPQNVEALEGLAEAAEDESELKERARALDERLRRLKAGAAERIEGFRHLAALYGPGRLDQPEKERAAWEVVRDEDPADHEAFEGLRRLYRTAGESELLVALLEGALDRSPRDEASGDWRRELALALRKLGRAGEIVRLWERALVYDEADTMALGELVAHHTARKNWNEVARLLESWLAAEPDRKKKADLWVQLARIRGPMLEEAAAAEAALEKALALRPDHPVAFGLLLEQHRTSGAQRKRFKLLEDRLGQLSRPADRAPLLRELWEAGTALRDEGVVEAGLRGTDALEELALLSPEDDALWEALCEAMGGVALAPDLAGLLEARAARLEDRRRAVALTAAARAWSRSHGRVGDRASARARRCLERARDAAPSGDPIGLEVRQELRAIYADSGAWEALAGVLEELATEAGADRGTHESAMEELAYTLQERLNRPAEAARWLERMMALGSDDEGEDREEQLIRLGKLEADLGRWDQVYQLLVRRLRSGQGRTDEKALRMEAAEVGWKRLGAPEKAIGHLRAALALDPDDDGLLARLEQACLEAGRIGEFSAILAEEAALTGDAARRADRLVRAGALKERQVGDLAGARRDYQAALVAAPEAGPLRQAARDGLARTLSAQRDFEALADLYRGWLEEVPDPDTRSDLCLALGLIYEDQLDDPERALANYRRALEADPTDVGVLDAVARVAEARGDLETALAMRTRQAAEIESPTGLVKLHTTLGRLQEGLGDDAGAVDAYRRSIELDPSAMDARRALVVLLRRAGRSEELVGAARALAVATRDPRERADLWTLVGSTLEQRGEAGQALAAFEHALAAVPDHPPAALAFARHKSARHPIEALHAIDQAIARLGETEQSEGLVAALATAGQLATTIGQAEAARSYFDQALRLPTPGREELRTLADALRGAERHEEAARCYANLIKQERRSSESEDTDPASVGMDEAIALRLSLGQCYLALERADDAIDVLRGALIVDPGHHEVLEALADAFESAGRWEDVVEVLATLRALEPDPRRARNTTIEMAEICSTQLADAGRAAAVLEEGLEKSPDDLEIIDRLISELVRAGQLELACRPAVHLLSLTKGPRARGRASLRLASLYARLPGRDSEVPALLRDAMSHVSLIALREEAVAIGHELAQRHHDGTFLATVLEIRLESERGSAYEAGLLRQLAETRRYHQQDPQGAIRCLEEVLALEPDDAKALEDLARLYEAEGEIERAITTYRRLFVLQPLDPVAREGLRRLFEEVENADGARLARVLDELLDEGDDESAAAHAHLETSALHATGGLDPLTRTQGLYPEAMRGLAGELARALGHEGTRAALAVLRGQASGPAVSDPGLDHGLLLETLDWVAERLDLALPPVARAPADALGVLEPSRRVPGQLLVDLTRLESCSPAELRFCAGRALMLCSQRSAPAVCLDPVEIRTLFEAAILVAGSEQGREGDDEAARLSRALVEAVPLDRHPTLVRAATRFRAEAQLPVAGYFEAVHQAGLRAGLLVAGSPATALHALRQEGKVARATLRELFTFSLAPEHLDLRVRLGMARSSR
ncbi:MAG: tetratricopeptide repeat protein [Deltaproteobacteria bacterium]|nr:tetratricopeptide repeat protein [Deltaproteobacteria bacterium]